MKIIGKKENIRTNTTHNTNEDLFQDSRFVLALQRRR